MSMINSRVLLDNDTPYVIMDNDVFDFGITDSPSVYNVVVAYKGRMHMVSGYSLAYSNLKFKRIMVKSTTSMMEKEFI